MILLRKLLQTTYAVCALSALALGVRADDSPVLHVYLPPDAAEAIHLNATTNSGALPAAVHTPSGTISAPDMHTSPPPRRVYQDVAQPAFVPDRDTRRPSVESYDDPFSPALTPFKRLYAYDAVHDDYRLYVRDEQYKTVPTLGEIREGDDRFFADMMVQLRAGEPVRIPTVGPAARMIHLYTSPMLLRGALTGTDVLEVALLRDGADNWFLRAGASERVRMVAEIAIARDTFASDYANVTWGALPPPAIQPPAHRRAFELVAKEIGISRQQWPREVVAKMVAYFRSFAPSAEPPPEHGDIYLDLALSRRGVCRHRAFAFLITALNIGIPARLIHNEAHAWVEVKDDRLWHRIDLGGAAVDLHDEPRLDRPAHVPPPDQFAWPTGRDSGADLAHRQREQAERAGDPGAAGSATGDADPGGLPDPDAPAEPNATASADRRPPTLQIDALDRDIFRGKPMRLRGKITAGGAACANVRVDVLIHHGGLARERRVGSLSTDERGIYDGAVVLPRDIRVGDYELSIATPGYKLCASGRAH